MAVRHEVNVASNARGAIRSLINDKPQIILAGTDAKKMDAYELLRHLQQEQINTPTIVVSPASGGKYQSVAMKLGAVAFLEYPIEEETLNETVTRILANGFAQKGKQPPITQEELDSNLTELEAKLNRHMKCFAGKNQVYINSFILGGGQKSKPRIALKCSLRQQYSQPPNVYYEYVRDVCCGNPTSCSAHQRFNEEHPER